jgi:hypothetical protein
MGRRSLYKDTYPEIAAGLCREKGYTLKQIAAHFKIGQTTLVDWMANHKDFKKALRDGRDDFDTNVVENKLLARALGYEYTEKTEEMVNGVLKVTKRVTKTMAPDVGAICFWLKNRRPDRWKEYKAIELSGPGESPLQIILKSYKDAN